MAAKTKTRTLADVIASTEGQVNAEIEIVRGEVAALEARLPDLSTKAADMADGITAVSEVKARWRRGEDVDPADYTAAMAEDARTADLAEYLPRRASALRQGMASAGTVLADHIAPAFKPVLPGVQVITTNAPYRLWSKGVPADTLALVIVEPRVRDIEVNPFTSERSGKVAAYFFRPGLYRPISVSALEDAGKALGVGLSVTDNRVGDEAGWITAAGSGSGNETDPQSVVVDSLSIRVAGVLDGLPIIRRVEGQSPVKGWCASILGGYSRGDVYATHGLDVRNPDGGGWRVSYGASFAMGRDPKVTETVNEDGERTLTMHAVVNASGVNAGQFADALDKHASGAVGGVSLGAGLLTEADVSLRQNGRLDGMHLIDVTLTYLSKVGQ